MPTPGTRSLNNPELLRELVQNLQEAIYITSAEGEILDANPAMLEMLGVSTLEELRDLHDRTRHKKMRNAEFGMRNASAAVAARANSHCNSAFRNPHSALGE